MDGQVRCPGAPVLGSAGAGGDSAVVVQTSTEAGQIIDIYDAAGLPKPSLSELGPDFTLQAQQAQNPHLVIEALRDLLTEESGKAARHNLVRQRAFSEKIKELMNRYTNQQLTSAEVIAELIEFARQMESMAVRMAA